MCYIHEQLEVIKLQYIDTDVLKLFLYMLFQTRSNNDHYMSGLADDVCEEAHSEMNSFNYKIRRAIEANNLHDLFEMPEEKKQNDSYFVSVFLKDKSLLLSFVKEYIENFRKDNLGKGYLIYKKQLEFIGQELIEKYNFYQDFYDTNLFQTTLRLETAENLPEKITMGLRPVEMITYLLLYKNDYIQLVGIDTFASDRLFDISLVLEFLKPADELFKELYSEPGDISQDKNTCQSEKIEAQLEVIPSELKIFEVDGLLFNPNNKRFSKGNNGIKFKNTTSKIFLLAEFLIKNPDKTHNIEDFHKKVLKESYNKYYFEAFKKLVSKLNEKFGLNENELPFINILDKTEFILNSSGALSSNTIER